MALAKVDPTAMTPNKRLKPLHSSLAQLRRRRARFRWATAASAVALAALVALAGLFLLDWSFRQNIDLWQRMFLMVLAVGGVAWAARRYAMPWIGVHEDEADMALLVQKQSGIDSDLIAALQFESSDAARWGSAQLETAVIDQVAIRQKSINVMASLPSEPLLGRLKLLGAVVVVWLLMCCLVPAYVVTFFHRLLLTNEHYPTQTRIVDLSINGHTIDLSGRDRVVHVAVGQPVMFALTLASSRSTEGHLEVTLPDRATPLTVPLETAKNVGDANPAILNGQLARLNQSASCKVFAGDAWIDPITLSVTPLPMVDIEADIVPPAYARQSADEVRHMPRGLRQLTAIAGSEIRLRLCTDRPLKSAIIKLEAQTITLDRIDKSADGREIWSLETAGTPLAAVVKNVPYAIQVVDIEDQSLDQPLDGYISIESDLPPRMAAATRTSIILASASPKIAYGATDDHALSRIWYTWEVTAGTANAAGDAANEKGSSRVGSVEIDHYGPEKYPKMVEQTCNLDLQSLHLATGDTLKVTFHAADYRGPAEAAIADAEPLVFQVTDLQGFEASMFEADQKSANILETMRKNLSGLGESQ